jgi:hypothetical protein
MDLVRQHRRVADPRAFWIAPRIRKFESRWLEEWNSQVEVPETARDEACR